MSATLKVNGYTSKEHPEYKKHLGAVEYCANNGLSYPKETSEFFKGKVDGGDLEDYSPHSALQKIKHGHAMEIPFSINNPWRKEIKVADIPRNVETIIIVVE